jgi:hypothetical protein
VRGTRATVNSRTYSTGRGAYLNFPGSFEEGEDLLRASYGEDNDVRLQAIKEQVDPAALFGPLGGVRPKAVPA